MYEEMICITNIRYNHYKCIHRVEYTTGWGIVSINTNRLYFWFTSRSCVRAGQFRLVAEDFMGVKR